MIVLADESRFAEGWCEPTLTREEAAAAYGREIPRETWALICNAFRQYSSAMQDRAALRPVKSNSRPESWYRAHAATLGALDAAIKHTQNATRERKLWQGQDLDAERKKLDAAFRQLILARRAIDDLTPPEDFALTKAEAEKRLVRDIRDAMQSAEFDIRLTHGTMREKKASRLGDCDLTPFEKLCRAFGIHGRRQPSTFVEWVHGAVKEN